MKKTFETISLLPYLKTSHGGFHLEIVREGSRKKTDPECPFQPVVPPRGLSKLVRANVQTDQGTMIKSLFLMVQNDDFPPTGDGLTRTTNTTIETLWQQTHSAYSQQEKSDHGFILFPGRLSLAPCFKPLFFCKKQQLFFHPPCPVCGNELTLCRDDKRLTHAGLNPFSTSPQRYLVCQDCLETNKNPPFYKWSRTPMDGIFVKDRFDLIADFKHLKSPGAQICDFPCTTCPLHSECYILDHRATERITFFAFYPFYMFVFKAPALNAVDFLALAAGSDSTPDSASRFFFKNDRRHFLEILFLKLSFLNQVLDTLGKGSDQPICSGTGLTAQSLWIDPLEGTTPLPWLWNFRVIMIDLLNTEPGKSHSNHFSTQAFLNFYSTLWFYALAVNKAQPLERVLNEIDNGQAPLDSPVLSMEQIFWHPDQSQVTRTYLDFWIQACTLGLEMRQFQGDTPLSQAIKTFSQKSIILHQKIKEALFSSTRNSPAEAIETRTAFDLNENQTLTRMLTSILQRWPTEDPLPVQGTEMAEQNKPVLQNETIEPQAPPPVSGMEKDNDGDNNEDEDILETVTLDSFQTDGAPDEPDLPPSKEEPLEKTVIMTLPGKGNGLPPAKAPVSSPGSDSPHDELADQGFDDLEATLILTPGKQNQEKKP